MTIHYTDRSTLKDPLFRAAAELLSGLIAGTGQNGKDFGCGVLLYSKSQPRNGLYPRGWVKEDERCIPLPENYRGKRVIVFRQDNTYLPISVAGVCTFDQWQQAEYIKEITFVALT